MSRPDESRGRPPDRGSTIEDIILYGGNGRLVGRQKEIGGTVSLPRCRVRVRFALYRPEVPTQPVSETSTVTPSGPVYLTSTFPVR